MKTRLGLVLALLILAGLIYGLWPASQDAGPGIESLAADRSPAVRLPLRDATISRDDLPPEGSRSLFDQMVRDNGSLPFPFDRVIDWLASYDAEQKLPRTLLIPDGRSLLKGHADFSAPRIVLASDAKPADGGALQPLLRGRLFLGFVEKAKEIEVISYNEKAGRFEFQLVENYCAGCVPRIVYAKRAICTTCHAGGGPIFPVRPWEETNAQSAIARRLQDYLDGPDYYGAPIDQRLDDAQAFDDLTDMGNLIPSTQAFWLDGCGESGHGCRRQLLDRALSYRFNPASLDQNSEATSHLLAQQKAAWPEQGIPLNNGNLNNRNPLEQQLYDESFGAQLRALVFPADAVLARSGDKLKDFDQLPRLPAEFDPLTPRPPLKWVQPEELEGVFAVAQMFSGQDIQRLENAAQFDSERLQQAIASLPDEVFAARPLRRVEILQHLLAALGQGVAYCCDDVSDMSPPIAQGEPPLELAEGSELKVFERYCFACHRGNPSARLNFMSGASEEAVLEGIQAQENLRDVLDYQRYLGTRKASQLMPPADSWQRQALNDAMEEGADPLAEMREHAPRLFDF